jgi:hypothetical protein
MPLCVDDVYYADGYGAKIQKLGEKQDTVCL